MVLNGQLLTPARSSQVLPGLTRGALEKMAERCGIPHHDAPVSAAQLRQASEVMLSAATREVVPVTAIDGVAVGGGRPGPVWRAVHEALQRYKAELAGTPW